MADHLLIHQSFLEAFVRRLVVNLDEADDVVQETWVRALEHPPAHQTNLRGWLRSVAWRTCLERDRRRRLARRAEQQWARLELSNKLRDAVEERELHGRVDKLLRGLEEPYETVLRLSLFEGEPLSRVAARLERPVNTVKSQFRRGVQRLRKQLDDQCRGDHSGWERILVIAIDARRSADGPIGLAELKRRLAHEVGLSQWKAVAALLLCVCLLGPILFHAKCDLSALEMSLPVNFDAELERPAGRNELALIGDRWERTAVLGGPTALAASRRSARARPSSSTVSAQRVEVTVVDHRGDPIEGATVIIVPTGGDAQRLAGEIGYVEGSGLTGWNGRVDFASEGMEDLLPTGMGRTLRVTCERTGASSSCSSIGDDPASRRKKIPRPYVIQLDSVFTDVPTAVRAPASIVSRRQME